MSNDNKWLNIAISASSFLAIILTEPLYRDTLNEYSLEKIPQIQASASETAKSFWIVYSDASMYGVLVLGLVITAIFRNERARAVYFAFGVTAISWFIHICKLYYADPRPFWASDDVQGLSCSTEYGNPSGHSMVAFGFSLLILLDIFETSVLSTSNKVIYTIVELLFGTSVGYSRFILGSHTANQILFGTIIGAWIAFTMTYVVREQLMDHLNSIVSRTDTQY